MTDDAYLFLLGDVSAPLGVPPAAVGDLACMETPAVRAWLDAQKSTPISASATAAAGGDRGHSRGGPSGCPSRSATRN